MIEDGSALPRSFSRTIASCPSFIVPCALTTESNHNRTILCQTVYDVSDGRRWFEPIIMMSLDLMGLVLCHG